MRAKYFLILAVMAIIAASGCDLVMTKNVTEQIESKTPAVVALADSAAETYEEYTGKPIISEATAEAAEVYADKTASIAVTAKGAVNTVTGFLPEDKQPYGNALAAILGVVTTVATGAAEWFRRRKNAVAKTAVLLAEKLPDGGKTLVATASSCGTATEVQKAYEQSLSAGIVGESASGK